MFNFSIQYEEVVLSCVTPDAFETEYGATPHFTGMFRIFNNIIQ